jgi:hypothetical protein
MINTHIITDFMAGTAASFVKLATATAADHETVVALTHTISSLTSQLAERDAWVKTCNAEIKHPTTPPTPSTTPTVHIAMHSHVYHAYQSSGLQYQY